MVYFVKFHICEGVFTVIRGRVEVKLADLWTLSKEAPTGTGPSSRLMRATTRQNITLLLSGNTKF